MFSFNLGVIPGYKKLLYALMLKRFDHEKIYSDTYHVSSEL